jgi:hypothetical protein
MFLNVGYLKVICCCTELTAELIMVRSYRASAFSSMWATLKSSDVVQNSLLS